MTISKPPGDSKAKSHLTLASSRGVNYVDASLPREIPPDAMRYVDTDWTGDPPPRTWLIPGLIPDNRVGMLVGEGGLGKSMLALQLCMALSTGDKEWLPGIGIENPNEPCSTMYFTFEEERDEVHRRVVKLGGADIGERLGDRLIRLDGAETGEIWGPDPTKSGHTATLGAAARGMVIMQTICEAKGVRFVVIDTAGHAFISDENNRGIVNQFLRELDAWARKRKIAVLLVSHPPKSSNAKYSGNSGWRGTIRMMLSMEMATLRGNDKDGDQWPVLLLDKSNYGVPRHKSPKWWIQQEADGTLPEGKMQVMDKKSAMKVLMTERYGAKQNPDDYSEGSDAEDDPDWQF